MSDGDFLSERRRQGLVAVGELLLGVVERLEVWELLQMVLLVLTARASSRDLTDMANCCWRQCLRLHLPSCGVLACPRPQRARLIEAPHQTPLRHYQTGLFQCRCCFSPCCLELEVRVHPAASPCLAQAERLPVW